jgi:hypothetical protein
MRLHTRAMPEVKASELGSRRARARICTSTCIINRPPRPQVPAQHMQPWFDPTSTAFAARNSLSFNRPPSTAAAAVFAEAPHPLARFSFRRRSQGREDPYPQHDCNSRRRDCLSTTAALTHSPTRPPPRGLASHRPLSLPGEVPPAQITEARPDPPARLDIGKDTVRYQSPDCRVGGDP